MRVLFQRDWFGPDGHLYQRSERLVNDSAFAREVPDELRGKLPSSAKVLGEDEPSPAPQGTAEEPVALGDLNKHVRTAGDLSARAGEALTRLQKAKNNGA